MGSGGWWIRCAGILGIAASIASAVDVPSMHRQWAGRGCHVSMRGFPAGFPVRANVRTFEFVQRILDP
jgi:hypothetical protein